jgi:hypothetical protein
MDPSVQREVISLDNGPHNCFVLHKGDQDWIIETFTCGRTVHPPSPPTFPGHPRSSLCTILWWSMDS